MRRSISQPITPLKFKEYLGQEGRRMGLAGKVVAAKAVKGRRDDKKDKKEAEKTEEKK
jgi:hypothetical protein